MKAAQCVEARRLLGWSQDRLAASIGTQQAVIGAFEKTGHLALTREGYDRQAELTAVLEAAGIVFDDNGEEPGAKLRKSEP